ncbi:hypothetical protein TNCV_3054451 [Trichonephila clavipes]|nr:hypothetical protein TNCV_3054451 [Trichonephila clavipes]
MYFTGLRGVVARLIQRRPLIKEGRNALCPVVFHPAFCVLLLNRENDEGTVSALLLLVQDTEGWFRQSLVHSNLVGYPLNQAIK